MARAEPTDADEVEREIRLLQNPDGWWTARDLSAEVTVQGESRDVALDNLDAVVDAVEGSGGHVPTDKELHELGIDPDVARSQSDELPDVLQ